MKKDNGEKLDMKLIHGDLPLSPGIAGGDFVLAEVTDTRLMGVVGLHIQREKETGYLHQFFYLDLEEYGFEEYRSLEATFQGDGAHRTVSDFDKQRVQLELSDLFGGLGGNAVVISEREALYLIHSALAVNRENGTEVPEEEAEIQPLLDSVPDLSPSEIASLWGKMCVKPASDLELVNYYIMRLTGLDMAGAEYLQAPEGVFDRFTMESPGTLFRNEIDEDSQAEPRESTARAYYSTSLIEDNSGYRIIRSETEVMGPKVTGFKVISDMRISGWEVSSILRQEEYVSVYGISEDADQWAISQYIKEAIPDATQNVHGNGILTMLYQKNNSHVNSRIYRMDHDTVGAIYIDNNGEILVSSSFIRNLNGLERKLKRILLEAKIPLDHKGRYGFPEATLGSYISGDYGVYKNFLDFIQIFTEGNR